MVETCIPVTIGSDDLIPGIPNTYLYIAGGVAAVAIAGVAAYFLVFKKKSDTASTSYRYAGAR